MLIIATKSYFAQNDSTPMRAFVSGQFTGQPLEYLVFSSSLIGWPLSRTYSLTDALDWYSIALIFSMLAATSILMWQIRSRLFLSGWLSLATIAITLTALRPDYTFVSIVGTGFLVAATLLKATNIKSGSHIATLLIFVTLLFTSSWRPEAGLLLLALMGPAIAMASARSRTRLRTFIPLLAPILAFVLHRLSNRVADGPWSEWLVYNAVRGTLHGTGRLTLAAESTLKSPWTSAELAAFNGFIYVDEPVFGLENVKLLDQSLSSIYVGVSSNYFSIIEQILLEIAQIWPFWVITIAAFLLPAMFKCNAKQRILVIVAFALVYWILLVNLVSMMRFPDQLKTPSVLTMCISIGFICTVHCDSGKSQPRASSPAIDRLVFRIWQTLMLGLLLITLFSPPVSLGTHSSKRGIDTSEAIQWFSSQRLSCTAYIASPTGLQGIDGGQAFSRTEYLDLPILPLGWPTMSPAWETRKANLGIDRPVLSSLIRYRNTGYRPAASTCFLGTQEEALMLNNLLTQLSYGYFYPVVVAQNPKQPPTISIYEFRELM